MTKQEFKDAVAAHIEKYWENDWTISKDHYLRMEIVVVHSPDGKKVGAVSSHKVCKSMDLMIKDGEVLVFGGVLNPIMKPDFADHLRP